MTAGGTGGGGPSMTTPGGSWSGEGVTAVAADWAVARRAKVSAARIATHATLAVCRPDVGRTRHARLPHGRDDTEQFDQTDDVGSVPRAKRRLVRDRGRSDEGLNGIRAELGTEFEGHTLFASGK